MNNLNKNQSKNIINQLKIKNISVDELSNSLNIDKWRLVAYLIGDIRFSIKHLNKICIYLKVSLDNISIENLTDLDIEKYLFDNNLSKSEYNKWLNNRKDLLCKRKVYLNNLLESC